MGRCVAFVGAASSLNLSSEPHFGSLGEVISPLSAWFLHLQCENNINCHLLKGLR